VPEYEKTELAKYNMFSCMSDSIRWKRILTCVVVLDMFYVRQNTPAGTVARRVYNTFDEDLRIRVENIPYGKEFGKEERKGLAHPHVSQTEFNRYLDKLGAGSSGMEAVEVDLFDHLKRTPIIHLQTTLWG
jgi:hypothetical protein